MAKTVVPRLRTLQRAQAEEEVGQVAEHDDDDDLDEGQPEGHQDGAVNEVLDLHARAGPHPEDVPRGGPALALGDEVDAVLFDVERLFGVGVVNDCELFCIHRDYLPRCASWCRPGRSAPPGSSVCTAPLSASGAPPCERPRCVSPHLVVVGVPGQAGSCGRTVGRCTGRARPVSTRGGALDGVRDHVGRRASRRWWPACAGCWPGRGVGGSLQGPEHVVELVVTSDGCRDRPGPVAPGRGGRARPEAAMNPVLLKPTSERSSQVIVMGRPVGDQGGADYQGSKAGLVEVVDGALAVAALEVRRGDLRGRRQPGRDQPARPRPREPGPGRPGRHPGRGGRAISTEAACSPTSSARWRCCPRSCAGASRASSSTGSGATPSCSATPWPSWRPAAASPHWACCPTSPGLVLDAEDSLHRCHGRSEPPRSGRRAARRGGAPPAPTVQLHRLRSPRRRGRSGRPLRRPPFGVRRSRPGGAPGDQVDRVRPAVAAGRRPAEALEARRGAASPPVVLGVCGGFQMLGRALEDPAGVESSWPRRAGLGWLPVSPGSGPRRRRLTDGRAGGLRRERLRDPARPH